MALGDVNNPMYVVGGTGGGGGGTGDASAAKQDIGNASLAAIAAGATPATLTQTAALSGVGSVFDAIDLKDFASISIDVSNTFVGTVVFEVSNDGGVWRTKFLSGSNSTPVSTVTATGMWWGDIGARYFRARVSAYTSGTMSFGIVVSARSEAPTWINATIQGGITPGVVATALGKAEDAPQVTGDTGVAMWAVRNDAAATVLVSANGDYSPIAVDDKGAQFSQITGITPGVVATALGKAEDAPHASGDTGVFMLGVRNDGAATIFTSANGDYGPIATDDKGQIYTQVVSVIPGVGAISLGKAEDAVHTSGDVGVQSLGVRNDNVVNVLTSANGDYSPMAVDDHGATFTREAPSPSSTVNVRTMAASTNQTLQAANPGRRGLTIYNASSAALNVKLGATASATSLSAIVAINGYYEVPAIYAGIVDGFTTGTGSVYVTEII